jgi:hypothetical protein
MPIIDRSERGARESDAPRPSAWSLNFPEGTFPTEFTAPDIFSDLDGEPWEAPIAPVLVATYADEWGRRGEVKDGAAFVLYLREAGARRSEGCFVGADQGALDDRITAGESLVAYKGLWVPDAEFDRVRHVAESDRRFPGARATEAEMRTMLEEAAAEPGPNAVATIQSAIYTAQNLGYPWDEFIAPIVKSGLKAALNAGR